MKKVQRTINGKPVSRTEFIREANKISNNRKKDRALSKIQLRINIIDR